VPRGADGNLKGFISPEGRQGERNEKEHRATAGQISTEKVSGVWGFDLAIARSGGFTSCTGFLVALRLS
jgi:hypothetical protein